MYITIVWLHDYVPQRGGCLQKSKVAKRFRVRDSQKTSLCGKGQHGNLFGDVHRYRIKSLVFKKDTLGHFITFFVYVRSKRLKRSYT